MSGFRLLLLLLTGMTMVSPVGSFPVASPTVRKDEETEIKSDYPSIVPPIWPEVTSPPSPDILHDDAVPGDDAFDTPLPSDFPSSVPSDFPSSVPSDLPSMVPSDLPSMVPSDLPSMVPSDLPSMVPTVLPSSWPSSEPSQEPSTIVFEAFGSIVDDAPKPGSGFLVEQQSYLPETPTPAKGRASKSMMKRRTRSTENSKKVSKIVRLLRTGLEHRRTEQP